MRSDLKGKKLLVMGGTQLSCEIIQKAQEMGIFVAVTDYNKVENSPGKQIADQSFMVSTTDVDAMVDLIQREKFDGVITGFVDLLLPYYAEICEKAGLPAYGTKEQFEVYINKAEYKKLCRQHHVPTVEEYRVELDNFDATTADIKYPVMVKPADSSGSRGITVCYCKDELKAALEKARGYSKVGSILVEQYLTGKELTIFWLFKDGKRYLTALGNRHVKNSQAGCIPLPVGYTFPARITEKYIKETEPCAQAMFEASGIQNGMMFMQCKVENDVCIVYDIGFRLTGSLEYKLLKDACGYDPMEMMIHFALTGSMGEPDIEEKINPLFPGYAFNVSLLGKPGKIKELVGCDKVKAMPGVSDVVINHHPGEEITESMRGLLSQIVIRVLGTASSIEEMKQKMYDIYNNIQIISETGENMLLPGMDESDFKDAVV